MPANRQSKPLLIRGGRIIDPVRGTDRVGDLVVVDGSIVADAPAGAVVFDAAGLIVGPGLVDIHVHLREPGGEHKEDIQTGCAAAAAGGFTTVACMPNTNPPLDQPGVIRQVRRRADQVGTCRVLPVAAITEGRAGKRLTDFRAMLDAGAVAFSDDGDGVEDDGLMREALAQAREVDAVLIQHCECKAISAGGVLNRGSTAEALGLPGIDPRAEEAMLERDLDLVRQTGARYHAAHVSTKGSIDLVRQAKADGLPVTAEVCPHHLLLTEEACAGGDPVFKMNPPLRTAADVAACVEALLDGTVDCVVTDHAPHTEAEKAVGFRRAPFGVIGLETALAVVGTELVGAGSLDWPAFLSWLSCNPLRIIWLDQPSLAPGQLADLCVIDPAAEATISPEMLRSRSRNCPFLGRRVSVLPVATVLGGRLTYLHPDHHWRMP